jgi:hypothetical protein
MMLMEPPQTTMARSSAAAADARKTLRRFAAP